MQFITVGRFVINANLIMLVEVYRAGNGSEVKIRGLENPVRLSDVETETLIRVLKPTGGIPIPLQGDGVAERD